MTVTIKRLKIFPKVLDDVQQETVHVGVFSSVTRALLTADD